MTIPSLHPVYCAVLNCFCNVLGFEGIITSEVCNGTRYFKDVIASRADTPSLRIAPSRAARQK